jgi:hypothetical protein
VRALYLKAVANLLTTESFDSRLLKIREAYFRRLRGESEILTLTTPIKHSFWRNLSARPKKSLLFGLIFIEIRDKVSSPIESGEFG